MCTTKILNVGAACLIGIALIGACHSFAARAEGCEERWYNTPSENVRCYMLQEELSAAALAGDVPRIDEVLERGANVNGGYDQSLPVLEAAASNGRTEAVKRLIEKGANVNRVRGFGQTALKSAVYFNHIDVVRILLDKGADVCEKTETSAAQFAVQLGDAEMIDLLRNAGGLNCSK
jgi:ankyrin repeat protein